MSFDRRKSFTKQPSEKISVDIDFGKEIPPGEDLIISGESSAVKWPRKNPLIKTDASNEILGPHAPLIVGLSLTKLRVLVVDGEHDYDYQITIKSHWNNGSLLEEELYVRVREE